MSRYIDLDKTIEILTNKYNVRKIKNLDAFNLTANILEDLENMELEDVEEIRPIDATSTLTHGYCFRCGHYFSHGRDIIDGKCSYCGADVREEEKAYSRFIQGLSQSDGTRGSRESVESEGE